MLLVIQIHLKNKKKNILLAHLSQEAVFKKQVQHISISARAQEPVWLLG